MSDVFSTRAVPARRIATSQERHTFGLVKDLSPTGDAPSLDKPTFMFLEAVYRLTVGLPGAWADSAAISRALAVLDPSARRLDALDLIRRGLIERHFVSPGIRWGKGPRVHLIRLTAEGAVEHFDHRWTYQPVAGDGA